MSTPRLPGRLRIAVIALISAAVAALIAALLTSPTGPAGPTHEAARLGISARPNPAASLTADRARSTCDPTASLRPLGPPQVTRDSFMAKIRARGYLIAGVDQNTYHFGYLDPFNGQIEGFDVDMLRAIAAAIFGNPNKIRFVAISDAQRIPAVQSGKVDIVAHTMTITCARLKKVDFSTVYFDAVQKVLVLRNFSTKGIIAWQRVCATTGSTSLGVIDAYLGPDSAVAAPYWTDCLVMLQQGQVTGISTDNSILAGLAAQDPYTRILSQPLASEPYGLAISKRHQDFVRFVNAVLAKIRSDGRWAASYRRWVGTPVPTPPPAHYLG